ncbi:MAG: flagellar biosynthesis protein FlhF [Gammaproteobacteria bacterium]|nr:MAG: flagellar biosynthesis protein FlhF [Gammaproteobacteria bacterium]
MSVKKIVASDMRQALNKVREQMGADAVILSNRKVQGGVEITASVDYQSVLDAHKKRERERKHVPAFIDESSEMVPAKASEHDLIKRDLEAAKEEASRRKMREQFAQERSKRVAQHEGLLDRQIPGDAPQATVYGQPGDYDPADELAATQPADAFRDPVNALQSHVNARFNEQSSQEDISDVKQELNQLKNLLNAQLNNMSWGDYSYRHPLSAAVFKRLRKIGLSAPLCRSLLNQVNETLPKKQAWQQVLEDLSQRLPLSDDAIVDGSGVVAFVGPAGVGKTTTIAKLAAEYALKYGPESLALITTDSYRIAGHEQLRTLAQILKVPLRIVNEQHPLDVVIRSLCRKKMIFIDTAGLSVKDESFDHQMSLLEKSSIEMKSWLVLSGTSQRKILEKTVNEYKHLRLSGSILTKLDESASLGEALSVIIENKLPMAYVTNGQNIPDDIQRPKANQLVNLAVSLSKEADCEESEVADVFVEAMAG